METAGYQENLTKPSGQDVTSASGNQTCVILDQRVNNVLLLTGIFRDVKVVIRDSTPSHNTGGC